MIFPQKLHELVNRLLQELQEAATLPGIPRFDFPAELPPEYCVEEVKQRCTRHRRVYSLEHGVFDAREIVMETDPVLPERNKAIFRAPLLEELIAPKDTYALDLMTHVGLESLLGCHRLVDLVEEFSKDPLVPSLSEQALSRLQHKFLAYLKVFHKAHLPKLREYFEACGGYVLIVDGTCEDGPPVLLVALEPNCGIVLGAWKICSENKREIRDCLKEIKESLGAPLYILIDLGQALKEGLAAAFPDVAQKKCHFHFLSDVGEDLCDPPQKKLWKAQKPYKLQSSLKTLRVDLRRRLLEGCEETKQSPGLYECLNGEVRADLNPRLLQQQMLLSIHDWIQDYQSDGHREGYPFDPLFLYLHRRLVRARELLDVMLAKQEVQPNDFIAFRNLQERIGKYVNDEEVMQAAQEFEEAYADLQRLRKALRLSVPEHSSTPRSETHHLSLEEAEQLESSIHSFMAELREELPNASPNGQRCIRIILEHLEKYGDELQPMTFDSNRAPGLIHRTTNLIEQFFRLLKRLRRRVHGRSSLRLDILNLPEELPLVLNLQNETYLRLTVGSLDELPRAFSRHWKEAKEVLADRRNDSGVDDIRLPKATVREEDFAERLAELIPLAAAS